MLSKGGDGGAGEAQRRQEEKEQAIADGISAVNKLFGTDERNAQYADHRGNVYTLNKNAIDKSYEDAQRDLAFGLARNHLTGSSIEADKRARQLEDYNENLQKANDLADNASNNLKQTDEMTRQNLVNSVQTGLDQTNAVSQALNNMKLNYSRANEQNVANNWDGMFDQWKSYKRNQTYNNYLTGEEDENQFGQTFFAN